MAQLLSIKKDRHSENTAYQFFLIYYFFDPETKSHSIVKTKDRTGDLIAKIVNYKAYQSSHAKYTSKRTKLKSIHLT
jgi:hypothetical protein